MSGVSEAGNSRGEVQERVNLGQFYRPIGIGAVAAAVSVTGKQETGNNRYRTSASVEGHRHRPKAA